MHRVTITLDVDIDLDRYRLEYGGSDDELADLSEAHGHADFLVLEGAQERLSAVGWATATLNTPLKMRREGYCPSGCRLNNAGDCVHTIQARARARNLQARARDEQ